MPYLILPPLTLTSALAWAIVILASTCALLALGAGFARLSPAQRRDLTRLVQILTSLRHHQ